MSAKPLLSIVIPCYNYASVLSRAVGSVLDQLDGNSAELLVVDDGSTDDTPQVVEQLLRERGGFRAIHKPNGGAASARNRGIEETQGDYLVFLDADDELAPGALQLLSEHLAAQPQSRMVIGAHWSVFPDGKRTLHEPAELPSTARQRVQGYLLNKTVAVSNGACAMHRDVFEHGGYPEHLRSTEDIPVFAQALAWFPCTVLHQPLALVHKHDDSLRHNLSHARATGLALVDEVFAGERLPEDLKGLRTAFLAQRCLSLFRTFYLAGDRQAAKQFYLQAVRTDWRVLFRWTYLRKAIRVL